jgi:hypothetical protein
MTRERPILLKGEMVRAILEDRKTQTRRILDLPIGWDFKASDAGHCILGKITSPHPKKNRFGAFIRREIYKDSGKFEHDIVPCKYGEPGDRLWVRENFLQLMHGEVPDGRVKYLASIDPRSTGTPKNDGYWWRKRPSIHMPRWASRITLEITDVRVERLQDISEADAKAEGVPGEKEAADAGLAWYDKPRRAFQFLWQSINGPDSWDTNPWVWVIEFKRITQEATQ